MKETVLWPVRNALSRGVCAVCGAKIEPEMIHLPARSAPASAYVPERARIPSLWCNRAESFGTVLGVPLLGQIAVDGSFLLFDFSEAFYDAVIACIREKLPAPESDCGQLALNRMISLSRRGGFGCPDDPQARAVLWQAVCLFERPGGRREAERALIAYPARCTPRQRQQLLAQSGAFADAAARILYWFGKD